MSFRKASLNEFSIIEKYFSTLGKSKGVSLGAGDDCAILDIPSDKQLVTTVDTLVETIHFPSNSSPSDIAQRSLRVNLSDIAAMGADPHWFTLALTLQTANEEWISRFSKALESDAIEFGCTLVGGDLTAGPLSITIQVFGTVDKGKAIKRSGVKEGDYIYVTGSLGEAAAAVSLFEKSLNSTTPLPKNLIDRLHNKFYRPEPRIKEGILLQNIASSAIDISDGLIADLSHILNSKLYGANIEFKCIPYANFLTDIADHKLIQKWVLSGGDDYELCFTVPKKHVALLERMIASKKIQACCIGQVSINSGIRCYDDQGELLNITKSGYQHF
jgi:thiamine-monophosphate kinase